MAVKPGVVVAVVAGVLGLGGAVAWAATSKKRLGQGDTPAFKPGVSNSPYVPAYAPPSSAPAYVPDDPSQPFSEIVSNQPAGPGPMVETTTNPGGGSMSHAQPNDGTPPLGESFDNGQVSNTQSVAGAMSMPRSSAGGDNWGIGVGNNPLTWRDAKVKLPPGAQGTALREGRGVGRLLAKVGPRSGIRVSGEPVDGWIPANAGTKVGWMIASHVQEKA